MNRADILIILQSIFRKIFKNPALEIIESHSADDIEKWDSMTNTIMIDAVEKEFGFKFSFRDIVNMQNVGDLIDLIIARKQANP
jgi:acyl carrier protein